MPGFDRTGPMGLGPMSGRGLGPCGSGYGRGRGFGRGFRRSALPNQVHYSREDELSELKAEKELVKRDMRALEEELETMEKRIKEMEKKQ